jgi:hypothetical protein
MKRALMFVLMVYVVSASADELKASQPPSSAVIHVATALDHLTVLEFGEPVMMAAAGSPAFQIERHEDKVFIKPLKAGASTDLFVWTATRRFTYELEPAGEVKNMNFAVDSRTPAPKPVPDSGPRLEEIADMMFTRAFVGAERVDNGGIKDAKNGVTLRIEHVFQSRSTLYIHYSVRNLTALPYHILTPAVAEVLAAKPSISLFSLSHKQLDQEMLRKLGDVKQRTVLVARAETGKENLQPGEEAQGVIAIREQVSGPAIFQLTFGAEGSHRLQATIVF